MALLILPNLVILGPPKCGASSLFTWLTAHPGVCGSKQKETFYLMDQDNPLRGIPGFHEQGWAGYTQQFPEAVHRCPVRVEATTHYLYQTTALEMLSQIEGVHVSAVLRDPAMRVWSSFSYTKNNLSCVPANVSFEQYLEYVLDGKGLPCEYCNHEKSAYVLERDVEYGEYARHLQPWVDRLGRGRVHCVLFEDLKERPREILKRLVEPFDVNGAWFDSCELSARNETYMMAHQGLHRLGRRVNEALQESTIVKPMLKRAYFWLQPRWSKFGERVPEACIDRLRCIL